MLKRDSAAFTLVEVLVVVVIVGLLAAMLLPAVLRSREAARQANCIANQGEIGKAIQEYELSKRSYPGYVNRSLGGRPISWLTVILPHVERTDLWEGAWRRSTSAANPETPEISLYLCPSAARDMGGLTSYVANAGVQDQANLDTLPNQTTGFHRFGVFHNLFHNAGVTGSLRFRPDDVKDGLQHTMLITENLQSGYWHTPANANGFLSTGSPAAEPWLGVVWLRDSDRGNCSDMNACSGDVVDPNQLPPGYTYARPSSNHSGGVVVCFCDGGARLVTDDIDYGVLRQMMTPDGRAASTASGIPGADY